MSKTTIPVKKINIRSPFYINVTDEGKPASIGDAPTVPEELVQPTTTEFDVECGSTVSSSDDVGTTTYKLDTGSRTGDVVINYSLVGQPLKFTAEWDGNTATSNFVGDSLNDSQLLLAGVPFSEISTTSNSNSVSGSVTINKSSASPSQVTLTVSAPIPAQYYQLTFNCPAETTIPVSSLPSPPPTHGNIIENIPVLHFNYGLDYDIYVNDVLVQTVRSTPLSSRSAINILSTETSVSYVNGFGFYAYNPPNETENIVRRADSAINWLEGDNVIRVYNRNNRNITTPYLERTGFVYDTGDSRWEFAGQYTGHPYHMNAQNAYHVWRHRYGATYYLKKDGYWEFKWNGTGQYFVRHLVRQNPGDIRRDDSSNLFSI